MQKSNKTIGILATITYNNSIAAIFLNSEKIGNKEFEINKDRIDEDFKK